MPVRLLSAILLTTLVIPCAAQQSSPVGVIRRDVIDVSPRPMDEPHQIALPFHAGDGFVRLALGAAGAFAGAYTGATAGMAGSSRSCDGPCFDGLGSALLGSAVGAAILAGLPAMHSHCGLGGRIVSGLLGSAAGTAAGFVTGLASQDLGVLVLGSLGGSVLGSAVGAELCH